MTIMMVFMTRHSQGIHDDDLIPGLSLENLLLFLTSTPVLVSTVFLSGLVWRSALPGAISLYTTRADLRTRIGMRYAKVRFESPA